MLRRLAITTFVCASVLATSRVCGSPILMVRDAPGGETSSGAYGGYFLTGTGSTIKASFDGGAWTYVPVGVDDFQYQPAGSFVAMYAFCIEPTQYISFGTNPADTTGTGYFVGLLANDATLTATQKDYIGRLWANAFSLASSSKVNAAAFQSVLWEVILDSTLNLSSGNFKLNGDDSFTAQVKAAATGWINQLIGNYWTSSSSVSVARSGSSQDLVSNVPEPGTIALMAMAGLMGVMHRAKRRRS